MVIAAVGSRPISALASEQVLLNFCNGCSIAQETKLVKSLAKHTSMSAFYLGNARSIHKFRVERDGHGRTQVRSESVEATYIDAYRQLIRFHDTKPYGFKKYYEFQIIDPRHPDTASYQTFQKGDRFSVRDVGVVKGAVYHIVDFVDASMTVYDAVKEGPKQSALLRAVRDDMLQKAGIRMERVAELLTLLSPADVQQRPVADVVLYFADGGKITLNLDPVSLTYKVMDGQARDSHLNAVPTSTEQLRNGVLSFDFRGPGNPMDRPNMRERLLALGATFLDLPQNASHYWCGRLQSVGEKFTAACKQP